MNRNITEELIEMAGPIEFYADLLDTLSRQEPRLKPASEKLNDALSVIVDVMDNGSMEKSR